MILLAQVERQAGNKQAAFAATERLLAVQPSNVSGMVLKSMLMSDAAESLSGDARLKRATEARHLAMAANKAEPDNPLTYVAFYKGYPAAGQLAPGIAVEGLVAAVEKLPSNTNVREMLVDEFTQEGRLADAIAALTPIANDPHDSPMRQAAREKMAQLKTKSEEKSATARSGN